MKKIFYFAIIALLSLVACEPVDEPGKSDDSLVAQPFSVSETKTVIFSPGNLQYHAANNEWRFAPSQLDYIGEDNAKISATYNGWIDLFGWGTGDNPTKVIINYDDYLTFVDWGENKIGSYSPNTWRTLEFDEWLYLLNKRPNASNLKGIANVNGVNGLVLLPDTWQCPNDVVFKPGFYNDDSSKEYYSKHQTISASDWSKLEISGAVFLPAAGTRHNVNVTQVMSYGRYWSSTGGYSNYAGFCHFYSSLAAALRNHRYYGNSVRLVKDN
ncbi:MAG: hypothetical protein UFP03_00620 [Paludibacteraceae bacterium]|nr:hypothetical protein [Paludibacteraceae bacterium]